MDGDDIPDIAVGAPGASNGGALYFICLNVDGKAKSMKEFSGSSGMGMDGDINKGDSFSGRSWPD